MKLNLKAKQQHQIPRVLLHCCGQSRTYNEYFAGLAHALCQASVHAAAPRGRGKRSGQHWKWNAKRNDIDDVDIDGLRNRKEKKMLAKEGLFVRLLTMFGWRARVCVCVFALLRGGGGGDAKAGR